MKKLAVSFLKAINIFVIILYLSACLTPFLSPARFWLSALSGLVFPMLFAVMVVFAAGWLLAKSKWSLPCLAAILLSWQQLAVMAGYRASKNFSYAKTPGTLRIMTWNVSSWGESNKYPAPAGNNGDLTIQLIKNQQADILCFQEFRNRDDSYSRLLNTEYFKKMGYPYSYFIETVVNNESKKVGVVIVSKYPLQIL